MCLFHLEQEGEYPACVDGHRREGHPNGRHPRGATSGDTQASVAHDAEDLLQPTPLQRASKE